MIIVGLGKDSKELAYLGVAKCPNCRNHSHFNLYAIADKLKLYFVSITNFSTRYFTVCSTCNAGFQVDKGKKEKILACSARIPDKNTFDVIRNRLDDTVRTLTKDGLFSQEGLLQAVNGLKNSYRPEHVDCVVNCFFNWMFDDDGSLV